MTLTILPRVTLDLRLAVFAALQLIMPCHISGFSVCWRLSSTASRPEGATKRSPERSEDWSCRRCFIRREQTGDFPCGKA